MHSPKPYNLRRIFRVQEENQVYLDCQVRTELLEILEYQGRLVKREIKVQKGNRGANGMMGDDGPPGLSGVPGEMGARGFPGPRGFAGWWKNKILYQFSK